MTDDTELLRRYSEEKSDEAFAELVRRHLDFVYAAALRQARGNAPLAQDVAQVVFTDLARKAATLARHEVVVGWLHTATRFAVGKAIRGESRRQMREQEAFAMNEVLGASDAPVDWERLHPVLDDVLGELKERERAAILLRFFEKKPLAEVGAKLALTESAARSCVDRALEKMHALLARRGVTSTSAALALALANQVSVAAPAGLAASVTGAALASAAGLGSSAVVAVKIFNLMSTTKIVSGVAGVVALLAIGSAVYQSNKRRSAAATVTAVGAERDALRAQLGTAEKRAQQSGDELVAAQKEISTLRAAAAAKPAEPPAASRAPSQGALMDYVLDHPETHAAFIQQQELRMKARYERFFRTAGLSAEQQNKVVHTLTASLADELDFMGALRSQGMGVGNMPQDPEERARLEGMIREKKQAAQADLRAQLGDERFQKFAQYSGTIPERNVADQLASQLYDTDAPLTAPQADQLAQILAQNRFKPEAKPSPTSTLNGTFITTQAIRGRVGQAMQQGGMNLLDWQAPVTDAAIARAESVLSPAQVAALKQLQAQQVTQIQLAPPPPNAPAGRK
jgi:RNA polymerase sigma factor (sigma-70 family)